MIGLLLLFGLLLVAEVAQAQSPDTAQDALIRHIQTAIEGNRCAEVDPIAKQVNDAKESGATFVSVRARFNEFRDRCREGAPPAAPVTDAGVPRGDGGIRGDGRRNSDAGVRHPREAGVADGSAASSRPATKKTERSEEAQRLLENSFNALVNETKASRSACKGNPNCPAAELRETELAWLTIFLAQNLPSESLRSLKKVFATIVIVLEPGVDEMIERLRKEPLTATQRSALLELIVAVKDEPTLLQKLAAILAERLGGGKAVATLLETALEYCAKSGCAPNDVKHLRELLLQLADPNRLKTLETVLLRLQQYPAVKARAEAAYAKLKARDPGAEKLMADLFAAVGPVTLYRIQLEVERGSATPVAPPDVEFIPLMVIREKAVETECRADRQFVSTYLEFLHYGLAGSRGFAYQEAKVVESVELLQEQESAFDEVSRDVLGRKENPRNCSLFPDVCNPPLPGTLLLAITRKDQDSLSVQATCWVDPVGAGQPLRLPLFDTTISARCGDAEQELRRSEAVRLVVDPPSKCSLLKPIGNDARELTTPPPVTSNGWHALYFAGAPYIQDSRSRKWSKVVPSLFDALLLVASGVSFGLAVKYRNDYAVGHEPTTKRADQLLNAGIGLSIGWFGVRAASAANYKWGQRDWRRDQ